jgi:hypothetical protein
MLSSLSPASTLLSAFALLTLLLIVVKFKSLIRIVKTSTYDFW